MKHLSNFINLVIRKDSKESSKRVIALICLPLIYYIVIRFTTESNALSILITMLSFILTLLGVAAWEGVRNKRIEKQKDDV